MITTTCDGCGGTFEVDDTWAGRRAQCGRCGAIVTIPEADLFEVDDTPLSLAGDEDDSRPDPADVPVEAFPEDAPILLDHATSEEAEAKVRAEKGFTSTEPTRSYGRDLAYTVAFPFRNLGWLRLTFLIAIYAFSAVLGLMALFPIYGVIVFFGGQFIIFGCLSAYCFHIIEQTCAGDDILPAFDFQPGEAVVRPFFRMLGTLLWVAWPALLWDGLAYGYGPILPTRFGDLGAGIGLAGAAVLLWPMTILTVAIFGFSWDGLRYDKLLLGIGRRFGAYLVTCAFLAMAATFLYGLVVLSAKAAVALVRDWFGLWCLLSLGASIGSACSAVIAMRVIGLFYRHNKRGLPWEAE